MTEQSTPSTDKSSALSRTASEKYKPFQNFLLGIFFGCIPVGVGLDTSSYMTHMSWLDYEIWKLAIAAIIPVTFGILSVALKGNFLKALGDVLSSTII
ncbi:MAG: hypothetical protein AAFP09_01540 [Cyanobacteria bacterium J06607_10]